MGAMWWLACTADRAPLDSEATVARAALQFALPLAEPELFNATVGVDHDPEVHEGAEQLICMAYDGRPFPACYDEHDGTDYLLDGGFDTMDAGSTEVWAAAGGEVVSIEDGHYDRCHGTLGGEVDCDGHSGIANHVVLEHSTGDRSRYWHLKKDSVLVEVGQVVECGEALGLVGSSGNSSTPHLHFEVEHAQGPVDPYAGTYSQPETWWLEQGEADDLPGTACPGPPY